LQSRNGLTRSIGNHHIEMNSTIMATALCQTDAARKDKTYAQQQASHGCQSQVPHLRSL
jgi:hypothetical protein